MDQALKARLIGAVVLVIAAVLVIPELLSGRKNAETTQAVAPSTRDSRTITIELGAPAREAPATSPPPSAPTQLPVPADLTQPQATKPSQSSPSADEEGAADEASSAASAQQPASARGRTVTEAPVVATTATSTSKASPVPPTASPRDSSGDTWSVQVGAFGSSGSAQKLASELERQGYPAYVATTKQGGKTLHRVRVGPVEDRAEANRLATRLKARRLPVSVVANE